MEQGKILAAKKELSILSTWFKGNNEHRVQSLESALEVIEELQAENHNLKLINKAVIEEGNPLPIFTDEEFEVICLVIEHISKTVSLDQIGINRRNTIYNTLKGILANKKRAKDQKHKQELADVPMCEEEKALTKEQRDRAWDLLFNALHWGSLDARPVIMDQSRLIVLVNNLLSINKQAVELACNPELSNIEQPNTTSNLSENITFASSSGLNVGTSGLGFNAFEFDEIGHFNTSTNLHSMKQNNNLISMDKKYQTLDGRPARILTVNLNHERYPVAAAILENSGFESVQTYTNEGKFSTDDIQRKYNLVEVKEKKTIERWVNIYSHGQVLAHVSKEIADSMCTKHRVACKKIEYYEGEGL